MLYVSVDVQAAEPVTVWQELSTTLFGMNRSLWQTLHEQIRQESPETPSKRFWGSSLFFGTEVSLEKVDTQAMEPYLPQLLGWTDDVKVKSSTQPWGKLWQLNEASNQALESDHLYVVLKESPLTNEADEFFQFGIIDQLELSLHKAYHHLRQHELGRKTLYQLIPELDAVLKRLLRQENPTKAHLSALARQYAKYVDWISQVAALQQTVAINRHNYDYLADEFCLLRETDRVYRSHTRQLKRGLSQLEADQVYYEAAQKRLDTGLQTVRAELELQLVIAGHKAADEREQTRIQREQEREKEQQEREREKREAQTRRDEEQDTREREKEEIEAREKEHDLLLAWIGFWLGMTQVWPIIQEIIESYRNEAIRLQADQAFLIVILLMVMLLLGRLIWKGSRRESQ